VFDGRLTDDGSRSDEPTGRAAPQTSREQEEEAEGGPVTVLEDAPLDFRAARACNKRLGTCKRRTGVRWPDRAHRSYAGGYEQYTHDGQDHSDTRKPQLLASR
jgi:hypothetical protein